MEGRGRTAIPREILHQEGFYPEESSGLFLGVAEFEDVSLSPTFLAVDDAIDLAWVLSLELGLIEAGRCVLALAGQPKKEESRQRLDELLAAGAKREHPGLSKVYQLVMELSQEGGARGLFVFMAASHGFSIDGADYLVVADTRRDRPVKTGIELRDIFEVAATAVARRRLVLLDVNRGLLNSSRGGLSAKADAEGFRPSYQAAGLAVLAPPGGTAYDDPQRGNGVFSSALIDGLLGSAPANERGFVTTSKLAKFAEDRFLAWVRVNRLQDAKQSRFLSAILDDRISNLPLALDPQAWPFVSSDRIAVDDLEKVRPRQVFLHRIKLENIRCFESLDIELYVDLDAAPLVLLVGENASGKSTLLRSIAIGLANASGAAALLKQVPGGLIRLQADRGWIELELRDIDTGEEFFIRTLLARRNNEESIVDRQTRPERSWAEDIFVCAYGTGRTSQATSSYDRYSLHQALLPLFDDSVSLQNPELILLRQKPTVRANLERRVLQVLMLEDPEYAFRYTSSGAQLHTPWGDQAPRTLSDGYRSTTQWLLDFLSWAIYAGRLRDSTPIGGMVILDEIEQHLHPRWQRHILQRLCQQFPGTQIFASTHTPLVASAAADVPGALLVRLEADAQGKVTGRRVEREEIVGLRADQMLAQVFGLYSSRSPGSQDAVSHFAELLGKRSRSADEELQLETLRAELRAGFSNGETELQREVEEAVGKALKGLLAAAQPEILDIETKRQIRELFGRV